MSIFRQSFAAFLLVILIFIFNLQSLDGASPTPRKTLGNDTLQSGSDKRERIFLGNGGFSLGFSKYHAGLYPFGGGGFGFGGSFLGGGAGALGGHYHHHNHAYGYGGGFSPAFGFNGGLGGWGYNPYYSPSLGAGGFVAGGGSYGFKHHHGYGHYNQLGYGGFPGYH